MITHRVVVYSGLGNFSGRSRVQAAFKPMPETDKMTEEIKADNINGILPAAANVLTTAMKEGAANVSDASFTPGRNATMGKRIDDLAGKIVGNSVVGARATWNAGKKLIAEAARSLAKTLNSKHIPSVRKKAGENAAQWVLHPKEKLSALWNQYLNENPNINYPGSKD